MPIYEYKCDRCDKVFEVRQKFSDEPLTTHPECGGPVHRLLSAPAFQFKGSGWYITDYARAGGAKKESGTEAKTESKTESKAGNGSKTTDTPAKSSSSETSTKSEK